MYTDAEIIAVLEDDSDIELDGKDYSDEEVLRYFALTSLGTVDGFFDPMAVSLNTNQSCGGANCCPLSSCLNAMSQGCCADCAF